MPITPKPFLFQIEFVCKVTYFRPFTGVTFFFHTRDPQIINPTGLTREEIAQADRHFIKGIKLFQNLEFEKAAIEFTKCIEIDSSYLDAYYNKAYAYQKLGKATLACEIWEKLKEMGQKPGEELYNENCK